MFVPISYCRAFSSGAHRIRYYPLQKLPFAFWVFSVPGFLIYSSFPFYYPVDYVHIKEPLAPSDMRLTRLALPNSRSGKSNWFGWIRSYFSVVHCCYLQHQIGSLLLVGDRHSRFRISPDRLHHIFMLVWIKAIIEPVMETANIPRMRRNWPSPREGVREEICAARSRCAAISCIIF